MAKAYITEFSGVRPLEGFPGPAQVPQWPELANQTVVIGSEAKSSAFSAGTRLICVSVDAICSIQIGTAPTATTSMHRMPADTLEYHGVNPGDKISVISNT